MADDSAGARWGLLAIAGAFGVESAVQDAGLVTLDDHDGHPSIRSLVDEGREVITF